MFKSLLLEFDFSPKKYLYYPRDHKENAKFYKTLTLFITLATKTI